MNRQNPIKILILATLAVLVCSLGSGCAEDLDAACSPIADGTYGAPTGETVTFSGGRPTGNWSCHADLSCADSIGCSPIGETVQTYSFRAEGGDVVETVSPPDIPVTLSPR